jgi:predicted nucleic acid-binding protein
MTRQTAFLVGQIQGQEAAKGNVLPLNDLMIAAAAIEQGYAILTENLRHFQMIPRTRRHPALTPPPTACVPTPTPDCSWPPRIPA